MLAVNEGAGGDQFGGSSPSTPPIICRQTSSPTRIGEICPGFCFSIPGGRVYEVANLLGHGTFAKVYKCVCLRTSEAFAVKVVSLQRLKFAPDFEQQAQMMSREVDILRSLRHERICNMQDFYRTEDHWFLVMELVCHGELFHNIPPNKGMREVEAKYVFQQLLEGIGYIHSQGVMHRDLKPENILIVRSRPESLEDGDKVKFHDVKIADFGLSKVRDGEAQRAKSCVGSPVYAAPEIWSEDGYGQSVDTWSLGAILFVMLCGQYPFDGRTMPRDMIVGAVTEVSACSGAVGIESVQLNGRNGEVRSYSNSDGPVMGPWALTPDERILSVTQEPSNDPRSKLGNSIAFFTSKGHVFSFDAPSAAIHNRFAAPAGSHIVGLEFDGSRLTGIRTVKGGRDAPGSVAKITFWSGSSLDAAELAMRDGSTKRYGDSGGAPQGPFELEASEKIVSVTQEQGERFLSKSLVFFTSFGKIISAEGSDARPAIRFAVPHGQQIERLKFEPDGRLSGIFSSAEEEQLCCANFKMDSKQWEVLSPDAHLIICGLLRVDVEQRWTLEQCSRQDWLDDARLPSKVEEDYTAFIKRGSKKDLISRAAEDAREGSGDLSRPPSQKNSSSSLRKPGSVDIDAAENSSGAPEFSPPSSPTMASAREWTEEGEEPIRGLVQQIRGKLCSSVDRIEFQMRKGHALTYGGHGGGHVGPFKLKSDEFITAVEQENRNTDLGYLGHELAFFTSNGRVFTLTGTSAKRVHRFAARRGQQICGLNLDGGRLIGVRTCKVLGGQGSIAHITARLGDCVDQISIALRAGNIETYGGGGGTPRGPFYLHSEEYVIAVSQEHFDRYLGMAMAFFTSMGNVIAFDGHQAARRSRFAAPVDQQIFGLHFETSRLVEVLTQEHLPSRSASENANAFFA